MTLCDHKNFELVLVLTGMKISKKQDRTLTTVFNKLLENVSFDFRFKKISTSGQTFKPITILYGVIQYNMLHVLK